MGKALYDRACARCHGLDGKGDRPDIQLKARMPNFARCAESAEETDAQWRRLIEKGGIVYGLSAKMPAYDDVLTREQIDGLLMYMREFCGNRKWVRGELNFQRPLFTEKTYPENELVISPRVEREKGANFSFVWNNILERRIGPRTQLEFALPIGSAGASPMQGQNRRSVGVGDFEVGIKQVLFDSLSKRAAVSGGLDVAFPSGRREDRLGQGTTKFEPFIALGKQTKGWIVQGSFKFELPLDTEKADREFAFNIALGYPVYFIGGLRDVFPMLEIVGSRELKRGEPNLVFLVPQVRLPIDRMGRWAFALGPTIPLTQRSSARAGFAAYLLYEYLGR